MLTSKNMLACVLLIGLLTVDCVAQESAEDIELTSLILIQRDLFDAQKTMTIYDLDEDGFIDASERKKLSWADQYADFDINKDKKLTHLEIAVRQAKKRAEHGITQFDFNNAKSLIRRRDKNNNGQLDPSEVAAAWTTKPEGYDHNSDGIITLHEYARQLAFKRGLRRQLGIEAVDNMSSVKAMKQYDANRDELLDQDELAKATLPRDAKLHDDDGDGKLSYTELAILFSKHRRDTGLSKSDAVKAKRLIAMADFNQDGKLTDKELQGGVFGAESSLSSGQPQPLDYKQYDANSDGTVTLGEIQLVIAAQRKKLGFDDSHLDEAKRLMLRHDKNRSTFLEPDEYPSGTVAGRLNKKSLEQADTNKDDKIALDELARLLAK